MYKIISKRNLAPEVFSWAVEAPKIARKRKPGQFVIIRVDEHSERIPITIFDSDPVKGTITLVIQAVGHSTAEMSRLKAGDHVQDLLGPLGVPTDIEHFGRCLCIAGGVGVATVYPIAKALREAGNETSVILGARSKNLLVMKEELTSVSDRLLVATDDGSEGFHGFVTDLLKKLLSEGETFDFALAVGPMPMMKAVCDVTRPAGIKTMVSLNPIMIDGTGMCGGCRVTVGGKTRFVCVDGPEFDGHEVDFEELMHRLSIYKTEEKKAAEALQSPHQCKIGLR